MTEPSEATKRALARLQAQAPVTEQPGVSEAAKAALANIQSETPQMRPALPEVRGKEIFDPILGRATGKFREPTRGDIVEARNLKTMENPPLSARLAARFGTLEDVKSQLPEGSQVGHFPDVGFMVQNPETGELELLDPIGVDTGDIAVEGLDLLPTAAEAITGVASRNPVAGAAAGGAARGGILKVLKSLGIVADPNILSESALEAGLSLAGPMASKAKRFISPERRAIESITSKGAPEQFAAGREQADTLASEVEAVAGTRPQFTTGEQLGMVEPEQAAPLIGAESTLDIGREATRSQRQASEALKQRLSEGAAPPEAVEPFAEKITGRLTAQGEEAISVAVKEAEKDIASIGADLEKISGNTQPAEIRSAIKAETDKVRKAVSSEYDSIAASAKDAFVDLSHLENLSTDMLDRARIFPRGESIFRETLQAVKPRGEGAVKEGLDSYQVLQEARSELRTHIRFLKDNKKSSFEIGRAEALEKEFTNTIDDALYNLDPKLSARLIENDLKFQSLKEKVDKGFVGKLLSTKEGQAVVPDEALVKTILSDTSETTRFLNAANEFFPEVSAKNKLKDAFYTQYREKVLSGKVTHQSFMNQIKDTGDLIFTPKELKALENAGSAKNRIKAIEKARDVRIKDIEKSFNVSIGKIEPYKLVAEVSKSPGKTRRLKNILTPEEWTEYQGARRARLVNDITDTKGNLNLSGIDKVLKGSEAELRESVGPEYIKDLKTTRKFLQTLAKKQSTIAGQKEKAGITGIDVTRAMLFGPLSHHNFVINKIKGLGEARTAKAMSRLLNNPELLRKRVEIFNSPERLQKERLNDFWSMLGIPLTVNRGTSIPEDERLE